MKQSEQDVNKPAQLKSKRPEDWNPEERLAALQQTYSLLGEDLNTWCRERGVFVHQLEQWKTDFCSQGDAEDPREEARALRALKVENKSLERELLRKDKALRDAAALLVLQIPTRGTRKVPGALGGRPNDYPRRARASDCFTK